MNDLHALTVTIISMFNLNPNDVNIDANTNSISWSIPISNIDNLSDKYEDLLSLESDLNKEGYELMIQDDNEYFGAQITKV